MTEADIQAAIAAYYDASAEALDPTDDDYLTRRILINRALHRWERDNGYYWDTLWTQDTSQVISTGVTTYSTPDDFRRAGGWVLLLNADGQEAKRIPVVKPEDAQRMGDFTDYAYFLGNPNDGFEFVLSPAPSATYDGYTIKYPYYKLATEYSSTTDTSEIPDPEYIIHSVVAELYKQDSNTTAYQTSLEEAEERLKGMEVDQVAEIDWQDSTPGDPSSSGFGM